MLDFCHSHAVRRFKRFGVRCGILYRVGACCGSVRLLVRLLACYRRSTMGAICRGCLACCDPFRTGAGFSWEILAVIVCSGSACRPGAGPRSMVPGAVCFPDQSFRFLCRSVRISLPARFFTGCPEKSSHANFLSYLSEKWSLSENVRSTAIRAYVRKNLQHCYTCGRRKNLRGSVQVKALQLCYV